MSPILAPNSFEFFSRSPAQTRRVGIRLGELIRPRDVVCLVGELGTGKTTFVQGIAAGWGSVDPVTSPTFVLINDYRHPTGDHLYHLDAYRLEGPLEAEDLDLESYLTHSPMVIEWADRIQSALPDEYFQAVLRWVQDEVREVRFTAFGDRYQKILDRLRSRIFAV